MSVGDYPEDRLEAYHFHEREWDSYEHLRESFEWEFPEQVNIAEYVCDRHAHRKNEVAIFYEDTRGREGMLTFWQLKQVTNRLANYLTDTGIDKGNRVAVCVPQKPETAVAHIGIWKSGGVSVPLSTLFGPEALAYRLDDSDTRVAIVDEINLDNVREVKDDIESLEEVIVVGNIDNLESDEIPFNEALDGVSRDFDPVVTEAEDDALIPYTSGTTGDPKGVRYPHRSIFGHLPGFICTFCNADLTEEDVFWHPSGWAWMGSLFDLVMPALYYGKPVLAYENYGPFEPGKAFEMIERYGLSCLYIPPTALRMMMNEVEVPDEQYDPSSVRVLGSGGESLGKTLPEWAADIFGATIQEAYGQTEATILVGNCSRYFEYQRCIGKPMPGFDIEIFDRDNREPVSSGEIGEIAVKDNNPTIFKGYWKKPKKTESKFVDNWMLTEDLAVEDEDGYLDFKSRRDDVIISSGYRIGPEEVEDTVAKHEAVADAGVIGVDDEERGTVIKAYVVLNSSYKPSENLTGEIQDFVKNQLAKYEYPRSIEYVEKLPKTTTGKIRRKTLREWEGAK
jgi:acetyl-CoA synthetase